MDDIRTEYRSVLHSLFQIVNKYSQKYMKSERDTLEKLGLDKISICDFKSSICTDFNIAEDAIDIDEQSTLSDIAQTLMSLNQ